MDLNLKDWLFLATAIIIMGLLVFIGITNDMRQKCIAMYAIGGLVTVFILIDLFYGKRKNP